MSSSSSPPPSLSQATTISRVDSHTYTIDLHPAWCIGSVPHGGYVTSCFLRIAQHHMRTTLARQRQPHPMTCHMEFPRRTEAGSARFVVRDVKLGRKTSALHVALEQRGQQVVLCYLNMADLGGEQGVTFPTGWALEPPTAAAVRSFGVLERGGGGGECEGEAWVESPGMPYKEFRKASQRVRFFFPRAGQPSRSIVDQWLRFSDGTRFTTESLGYVSDMFPMVVESYREDQDEQAQAQAQAQTSEASSDTLQSKKPIAAKYWYPTVVLNLDIKKPLPDQGVDWLFCRVRSKAISNGRLDLEVIIMDEAGDLVALSHHVALILDASRNLAARRKTESSPSTSKI